jgi:hypothetical protein
MRAIRLLPVAFIFVGLMTFIERGLNDEMSRLSAIRSAFSTAVVSSRGRLAEVAWAAISDPIMQQNFEQGNLNTVTQSLDWG